MVCSEHFVDGIPTVKYHYPTLKPGYELKQTKPRGTLFREPLAKKPKQLPASSASTQSTNNRTATIRCSLYFSTNVTIIIMSRLFFNNISL